MRKFLKGLDLPEDTIDAIMAEYGSKTTKLKETNDALNAQLKQIESIDPKALQDQIAQLTADKDSAIQANEQLTRQVEQMKFDNAFNLALAKSGAKNEKALMGMIDKSKIQLGEDGKLNGFDEQLNALKTTDAYLFEGSEASGLSHNDNPAIDDLTKYRKAMHLIK